MAVLELPLPDFPPAEPEAATGRSRFGPFSTIVPSGLRALVTNPRTHGFDLVLIIDSRFEYEWKGGHIKDSVNVRTIGQMELLFEEYSECNVCIVFHCEFSHDRGPEMMCAFREHDRLVNLNRYPHIIFPSIVLLEGGYSRFFRECRDMCDGGYIPMAHPEALASGDLQRSFSAYMEDRRRRNRPGIFSFPGLARANYALIGDSPARKESMVTRNCIP
jgi:hypothetical protein